MKKSLLFAALLTGAISANAQTEVCWADVDAAGLTSEKATIAGGTVVGQSESVTMKLAYDDSWGTTSIAFNGYTGAKVNGEEVTFVTGFTGNTNPGGTSIGETNAAATSGGVVQFDVTKDGYLTVFGKLSSNKPYYVWEGLAGMGEEPVAYTLAMDITAYGGSLDKIVYTMPADDMGYVDFSDSNIDTYISGSAVLWPITIALDAKANGDSWGNGVGAITFPVYADAGSYLVHATGSKISTCGAVFTTEPVTQLVLTGTNEDGDAFSLALIGEDDTTGISNITAAEDADAPAYNIAGQRVNADAKGLVIKNGKKYMNK